MHRSRYLICLCKALRMTLHFYTDQFETIHGSKLAFADNGTCVLLAYNIMKYAGSRKSRGSEIIRRGSEIIRRGTATFHQVSWD